MRGREVSGAFWTNPSVQALSHGRDPVETITAAARDVVFHALEQGWQGPPFDPFRLAELLRIETTPSPEVLDAQTVPAGRGFRIDFNPDRPRRRLRYSIFHEIAHTLFPDCGQTIRHRGLHSAQRADDWQLETLCNMAAAEFLLPVGVLGIGRVVKPTIQFLLQVREQFEASAEAALLRIARLTADDAVAFACHRTEASARYVIEYAICTGRTSAALRPGSLLPAGTGAAECTAIGYTAEQAERWPQLGDAVVGYVGVSPLPQQIYPRVIGFARPATLTATEAPVIKYVRGDATQLRGQGPKILVQLVSDSAFTWGGGGFSAAVKRKWPAAHRFFTSQVTADRNLLHLGSVVTCDLDPGVRLMNVVAQRGFGPSPRPRVRYGALREGLLRVGEAAKQAGASVHMPRIGAGQAGGAWGVVEEIINETIVRIGVQVVTYDLPQGKEKLKAQADLTLNP
jgi:hypothetical protein